MPGRTVRLALCGLIASVAVVAAGCGSGGGSSSSSSSTGGGGNQTAANQTLTMAFGSEPPSLDPGLATDTSSANILYNIMDPLIKLGPSPGLKPEPGMAESWDVERLDRDDPPPPRRQVVERPAGDRAGLRLLVAAHDLAGARRRLRVPVLRDQGRRRLQRLRPEEGRLQRAQEEGRDLGARQVHDQGRADLAAALVHPAARPHLVPRGQQGDRGEVGRQVDGAGPHRHERPVQADAVAAQRPGRAHEVERLARREQRQAEQGRSSRSSRRARPPSRRSTPARST